MAALCSKLIVYAFQLTMLISTTSESSLEVLRAFCPVSNLHAPIQGNLRACRRGTCYASVDLRFATPVDSFPSAKLDDMGVSGSRP